MAIRGARSQTPLTLNPFAGLLASVARFDGEILSQASAPRVRSVRAR